MCTKNKSDIIEKSERILKDSHFSDLGNYYLCLDKDKVKVLYKPTSDDNFNDEDFENVESFIINDKDLIDIFNSSWFEKNGYIRPSKNR